MTPERERDKAPEREESREERPQPDTLESLYISDPEFREAVDGITGKRST